MNAARLAIGLFACLAGLAASAQTVEILSAKNISRNPDITTAQRFLGDVVMNHRDAVLRCDSAWRYASGEVEVFGRIRMDQPPSTTLNCAYLRLEPQEEWALARGDVLLSHDGGTLRAPELRYHIGARKARYTEGAAIAQGAWQVTSQTGRYDAPADRLELGGNVVARNGTDTLQSDSLHWLRSADRYLFHGATTWRSPDGSFACLRGDVVMRDGSEGKDPTGWLAGDVEVLDGPRSVRCDSLEWRDAVSETWGNVWLGDGETTVAGTYARRSTADSTDIVRGAPARLTRVGTDDTLRVEALHLWARGEVVRARDAVHFSQGEVRGQGDSLAWRENAARGDQARGNQMRDGLGQDSPGRDGRGRMDLWGTPRLWVGEDALRGDTVRLFLEARKPALLELRGHAHVASPANDSLNHEIAGRTLDARFEDGRLHTVDVLGNGELTYYDLPDTGEARVNRATCAHVTLTFRNRQIAGIHLQNGPRGRVEPLAEGGE
jgi:hypothetical protein